MEIKHKQEKLDRAVVEVSFRPKSGLPSLADRQREYIIRSALESVVLLSLHPRTLISIVIQVVEEDGGVHKQKNVLCFCLFFLSLTQQKKTLILGASYSHQCCLYGTCWRRCDTERFGDCSIVWNSRFTNYNGSHPCPGAGEMLFSFFLLRADTVPSYVTLLFLTRSQHKRIVLPV